jgi:hypothetical protein
VTGEGAYRILVGSAPKLVKILTLHSERTYLNARIRPGDLQLTGVDE